MARTGPITSEVYGGDARLRRQQQEAAAVGRLREPGGRSDVELPPAATGARVEGGAFAVLVDAPEGVPDHQRRADDVGPPAAPEPVPGRRHERDALLAREQEGRRGQRATAVRMAVVER